MQNRKKSLDELESHAYACHTGKMLMPVPMVIDNRISLGQIARDMMVVCDDHSQTQIICIFDLIDRVDPAVNSDEKLCPPLFQLLDGSQVETVSFRKSVGNIKINRRG